MAGSAYDDIATMYHELWAHAYLPAALPALERLFFERLAAPATVLDVCCGSGHVTRELVRRGYRVTGVDSSAALVEIGRREWPQVAWQVQDARELKMEGRFEGAISTYDSLNHMLSLEDVHAVFSGVYEALAAGGLFVFDMNVEEAYELDLQQWTVNVLPNAVALSRGLYDVLTHTAQTELIWFQQTGTNGCWQRRQSVVEERCYEKADVVQALQFAGFHSVKVHAALELGVDREFGHGRYFFSARRGG